LWYNTTRSLLGGSIHENRQESDYCCCSHIVRPGRRHCRLCPGCVHLGEQAPRGADPARRGVSLPFQQSNHEKLPSRVL